MKCQSCKVWTGGGGSPEAVDGPVVLGSGCGIGVPELSLKHLRITIRTVRERMANIELTCPPGALKQHVFVTIVVLWQLNWALGQNGGLPADALWAEPSNMATKMTAFPGENIVSVYGRLDR